MLSLWVDKRGSEVVVLFSQIVQVEYQKFNGASNIFKPSYLFLFVIKHGNQDNFLVSKKKRISIYVSRSSLNSFAKHLKK